MIQELGLNNSCYTTICLMLISISSKIFFFFQFYCQFILHKLIIVLTKTLQNLSTSTCICHNVTTRPVTAELWRVVLHTIDLRGSAGSHTSVPRSMFIFFADRLCTGYAYSLLAKCYK